MKRLQLFALLGLTAILAIPLACGNPGHWDEDGGPDGAFIIAPANMVFVNAGCFDMGDSFNELEANDEPVHNVCLSQNYYMDIYEVTNSQYKECADSGFCDPPQSAASATRPAYYGAPAFDDFPVINVSWNQAAAYCAWAGKRLPTEAEWELAARGGIDGRKYFWGDTVGDKDINYLNSGDLWDNDTAPVGSFAPNRLRIHDMAGNVWEWVYDRYQADYYSVSPVDDPTGPAAGSSRVYRGGGWDSPAQDLRIARRDDDNIDAFNDHTGFRCAWDRDTDRRILYISNQTGFKELWSMNIRGGDTVQMTSLEGNVRNPKWSPDGSKIAFINYGKGLYTMDPDGSNQKLVIPGEKLNTMDWRPDGQGFIYSRVVSTCVSTVYINNLQGDNETTFLDGSVIPGKNQIAGTDYYSPDGARLLLWAQDGCNSYSYEIYVGNADGSSLAPLSGNSIGDVYAIWNAEGDKVFWTKPLNTAGQDIYSMNTDGTGEVNVTSLGVHKRDAFSSMDGGKIFFREFDGAYWQLWMMNEDGSGRYQLTDNNFDLKEPDVK
jgi:formylglycine-generating enzyme required for sulfatase activity